MLASGVLLRDISGRLAFVAPAELDALVEKRVTAQIRRALGSYAREDRVLMSKADFGSDGLLSSSSAFTITVAGHAIRLIDRRLVGADWLRSPADKAPPPPRFVFASLKGGVGRSTALSIAAAHLATSGKRVLAVDLDMEAPGLGSLLLDDGTLPEFGLIDALVENGLVPLDEAFLADLVGPSDLASRYGRIDVIPAFGRRSLRNPADVLSKIARAYAEDLRPNGTVASILDQISELVDRFSDPTRYDAILVDARAGLHETTASAILGLGAEVFLFGLDEPQTFQGYEVLLAHLARFAPSTDKLIPEWLERLSMVQGKAPVDAIDRDAFTERCRQLFIKCGLEKSAARATEPLAAAAPFSNVPWNDEIPDNEVLPEESLVFREPTAILNDDQFRLFNPRIKRDLLSEALYKASYGAFLNRLSESIPDMRRTENVKEN